MNEIKENLGVLFNFLSQNRSYNIQTQFAAYASSLRPWGSTFERVYSLLHGCAATQSRPKLDKLALTWQRLHENKAAFDTAETVDDLLEAMRCLGSKYRDRDKPIPGSGTLDRMWAVLDDAPGFGAKTAALFVKAVINIHQPIADGQCPPGPAFDDLRFLETFEIEMTDTVRIPVDSVIRFIFAEYIANQRFNAATAFGKINDVIFIEGGRNPLEAVIWDDLWFWGFITQRVIDGRRKLALNPEKFWAVYGTPKDKWKEVKGKAGEFIDLLKNARGRPEDPATSALEVYPIANAD